jgi:hypothetical protein
VDRTFYVPDAAVYACTFASLFTDVIVATLIMYRIGPRWPALAAPIVVNGLGVPVELALVLDLPFWYSVLWVTAGEAAVMLTLGIIVLKVVRSGVLWPWGRPQPRGRPRHPIPHEEGGPSLEDRTQGR